MTNSPNDRTHIKWTVFVRQINYVSDRVLDCRGRVVEGRGRSSDMEQSRVEQQSE